MYNYDDFEASIPTDKASIKVLLNDYFHDSPITSIQVLQKKREVTLQIQCRQEWESINDEAYELESERFTYILTFGSVSFCDIQISMKNTEYINGRFKAIPKGKYYFRIQTSDGFIDICYRSFTLQKAFGRVSYRKTSIPAPLHNITQEEAAWIKARIEAEVYLEEEDMELALDLERLYASGLIDSPLLRHCLTIPWDSENARPFAAWLLGKFGEKEDIPILYTILSEYKDPMIRRNLYDAIHLLELKAKI